MAHELSFENKDVGYCDDRPDCHTFHVDRYALCSCGEWRVQVHAGRNAETAQGEFRDHRTSELEKEVARIHQLVGGGD